VTRDHRAADIPGADSAPTPVAASDNASDPASTSSSDAAFASARLDERLLDERLLDERLLALETRVAYQDHLLASLDDVVREFTARVEKLERRLDQLDTAVEGLTEAPVGDADDAPPHF
jgi:uncharacterized coiled-coil protein SlyX